MTTISSLRPCASLADFQDVVGLKGRSRPRIAAIPLLSELDDDLARLHKSGERIDVIVGDVGPFYARRPDHPAPRPARSTGAARPLPCFLVPVGIDPGTFMRQHSARAIDLDAAALPDNAAAIDGEDQVSRRRPWRSNRHRHGPACCPSH